MTRSDTQNLIYVSVAIGARNLAAKDAANAVKRDGKLKITVIFINSVVAIRPAARSCTKTAAPNAVIIANI